MAGNIQILIIAIIGFILTGVFWALLHESPNGTVIKKQENRKKQHFFAEELRRLREVCKNKQNWWIGLYAFAIWAPVTVFPVLWGVPFLMARYHLNAIHASGMMSLMWIGIGIGCPLVGWWSDHIKNRRLPLFLSALVGLFLTIIVLYFDNISLHMMYVLLFAMGASVGSMVVTFGCIKDNNHTSVIGTADGLNNMLILIGGMAFQPMVGIILDSIWDGKIVNNLHVYSNGNYQIALTVLPICFLICILSVFFIKETHCETKI